MSNRCFPSVWKAKLSCHFHLCKVHSRDSCAMLYNAFLLLSDTERKENGNMNQVSNFPSHIQLQAEMMSNFRNKTSLSSCNIWEEEIQRKPKLIKRWCWWFNRQHPYCKVCNELRSLCDTWLLLQGTFDFHRTWGKEVHKCYTFSHAKKKKTWWNCKTSYPYSQDIQPPVDT